MSRGSQGSWDQMFARQKDRIEPTPTPEVRRQQDTDETLPGADEDLGNYCSRPTPKFWNGVHFKRCVTEKEKVVRRSFQYVHLGYQEFDLSGEFFVLEFNEPEKWRLVVSGIRLWKVYNYLIQHRLEWLDYADRGFAPDDDDKPFIKRIQIARVKEEEEQASDA